MQLKTGVVLALLIASVVPFVPGAAAETVTRTWTQTSQIDFSQGSGTADVSINPGSVQPGGGLSHDVSSRWSVEADAGCYNWCFDRSYQGSPYVTPGKGSIYFGRGIYTSQGCCYRSFEDRISIPAANNQQFTIYMYPSSYYQQYWYGAYMEHYLRISDANGNQQDFFLKGVRSNGWSSYYDYYGSYQQYVNINGWNWYKFVFNVPGHFDQGTLKAALRSYTWVDSYWSCCSGIYMWNYYAFGSPPTSEFVSNVHNTGGLANWGAVNVDGYVPSGATLKVQTRTSGDGVSFSEWAGALSGEPVASPAGQFIQYRALFTRAPNGAEPRLDEVRVSYSFTVDTNPPRTAAQLVGTQGCAGWYTDQPYVVLTAQDDASGVASTMASLDGGLFQPYGGPFQVGDGVHTLDYFSTDGAGNVEGARSLSFKVDSTTPGTSIDLDGYAGDQLYVRPDAMITLDAADATSGVKATTVNTGAGAAAYTGPFSLGGADGPRSIAFGSEDRACNVEAEQRLDVFVDGTAPDVALTAPAAGSLDVDGRALPAAPLPPPVADAVAELRNRLPSAFADANTVLDILRGGADELCGPALTERCAVLALADAAPRPGGTILAGTVRVAADATDPAVNGGASGLAGVAFVVDGAVRHAANAGPFEWAWDTRGETLGRHVLEVVAVDHLGNAASASMEVTVVPLGLAGALATGAGALDAVDAPDFAQDLYAFAAAKVLAQQLPSPPPTPDPAGVVEAVQEAIAGLPLPPLPVSPPEELPPLPVEPPGGLPPVEPPVLPPLPPVPQLCIGDVCSPTV